MNVPVRGSSHGQTNKSFEMHHMFLLEGCNAELQGYATLVKRLTHGMVCSIISYLARTYHAQHIAVQSTKSQAPVSSE